VNYHYHPDARKEASAVVAYYAVISRQLGSEFLIELEGTINRIVSMPEAWAKHVGRTRRCLMHRFPYGVVYIIESEAIHIVAISHLHRKPDYWLNRISAK
jgi:hypothetical protein